jgi:hypothetical protein
MPILQVYVSDLTFEQLKAAQRRDAQGRTPAVLAEAAVEEAALRDDIAHRHGPILAIQSVMVDGRQIGCGVPGCGVLVEHKHVPGTCGR